MVILVLYAEFFSNFCLKFNFHLFFFRNSVIFDSNCVLTARCLECLLFALVQLSKLITIFSVNVEIVMTHKRLFTPITPGLSDLVRHIYLRLEL